MSRSKSSAEFFKDIFVLEFYTRWSVQPRNLGPNWPHWVQTPNLVHPSKVLIWKFDLNVDPRQIGSRLQSQRWALRILRHALRPSMDCRSLHERMRASTINNDNVLTLIKCPLTKAYRGSRMRMLSCWEECWTLMTCTLLSWNLFLFGHSFKIWALLHHVDT